jgi:UDP:flavonoid glycosyltransferase YjiC (YdhE family)
MAVPPNLIGFVESAGLTAVGYGPDSQEQLNAVADLVHHALKLQNPINLVRAGRELFVEGWAQMSRTLISLADGADLLVTGQTYHGVVCNVAECYDIPLAAMHYFPIRVNGQLALPSIPSPTPLIRSTMRAAWWVYWRITKEAEDAQRRELGLAKAAASAGQRMAERGSLEIQAYDEVCFPGLAAEWAQRDGLRLSRPFVGALALELPTDSDQEVASWIAAGKPPIFFGFGSIPVESPADTLAMISEACAQLGERALICSAETDFSSVPHVEHVKVVGTMNYAEAFPACRAVVHHGGVGTTAASLRAGVPTLILSTDIDQTLWGARVKRLKVGTARRFSTATRESLVADLRTILAPEYKIRAREVAAQMTKPAVSVAAAADLVEDFARLSPR